MIQLTLTQALALYSIALGAMALAIWIYTEVAVWRPIRTLVKQNVWRCVFCGYTFLDDSGGTLAKCPRCESINSAQDKRARLVNVNAPPERVEPARAAPLDDGRRTRNPGRRKRPHQRRRGPRRR